VLFVFVSSVRPSDGVAEHLPLAISVAAVVANLTPSFAKLPTLNKIIFFFCKFIIVT